MHRAIYLGTMNYKKFYEKTGSILLYAYITVLKYQARQMNVLDLRNWSRIAVGRGDRGMLD